MRIFTACSLCMLSMVGWAAAPAAGENPIASPPPASPPILLKTALSDRTPCAFARHLSDTLGVEVRLPRKTAARLSVPAGEWTAPRMLEHVARELKGSSWQQVFRFAIPAKAPTVPPVSKLPSLGRITLAAENVSFERAVDLIQQLIPCEIELPEDLPALRLHLSWRDLPLESALADLAVQSRGKLVSMVVFQFPDAEAQEKQTAQQQARSRTATQQQAQVANRLREAYGQDPDEEGFPWDNIDRPGLARSLARELGLSPGEVDSLIERVRLEALTHAWMRQRE